MDVDHGRRRGAAVGFGAGGLPGLVAVLAIRVLYNARFIDDVASLYLCACVVPGLIGAAVGAAIGRGPRWGAALIPVPVFALWLARAGAPAPIPGLKLLVIGVDGATWEQVEPIAAQLPEFERLRAEGASGTMLASGPLFSPLLWTALATGRSREDNGISGFHTHSTYDRVPTFWDIAESRGERIGIYKWLVTWPPRKVRDGGFIVPGWLAPTPETEPADLSFVKEIELSHRLSRQGRDARRSTVALGWDAVKHGLRWTTLRDAGLWTASERLLRPSENDRFLALNLLRVRIDRDVFVAQADARGPTVATFTDYATDALGHRFWRYHEPTAFGDVPPADVARYGEAVRDAYRQADALIGELRGLVPPTGRVVVISDHGFHALPGGAGVRIAPRTDAIERHLGAAIGPIEVARIGARVPVVLAGPDPDAQRAAADAFLATVTRADDGSRLFRWAQDPDDPHVLVLDLLQTSVPAAALDVDVAGEPLSAWVRALPDQSGDHTRWGLFAAVGPGVRAGAHVDVGVYDVAPILLAALGLPRDPAMAGAVPDGVWPDPGVGPSWQPVRDALVFPKVDDAAADNELLEQLGYVDPAR